MRNYLTSNQKLEVAKEIINNPKKKYSEIADDFGVHVETVKRIAAEYGVQRNPRPY